MTSDSTSTSRMSPPRVVLRVVVILLLAYLAKLYLFDRRDPSQEEGQMIHLAGETMGTTFNIKFPAYPEGLSPDELHADLERELGKINRLMSTYDPNSEISRFNDSRETSWFPVSSETAKVVALALEVGRLTGGALDVTIAPLVNRWSFGPDQYRLEELPPAEELESLRERVDFTKLQVRRDPPALKKELPELVVDLSAVAKGYAVDRLADILEGFQIESFMVEVGGEVRVGASKPEDGRWKIGLEIPDSQSRDLQNVLELEHQAMATSGDYRNFIVIGDRRFSHLIDPRTGYPTEYVPGNVSPHGEVRRLGSVAVLDEHCARADALATGLFVLGLEEGLQVAEENDLCVLFIVRSGGEGEAVSREYPSKAFRQWQEGGRR